MMSDDDGFDDFLSEDEEQCTLQTQEMEALARKMKTVGVREAIDHAKDSALQEGFDDGFAIAAADVFHFSALRGALCVALVSGVAGSLDAAARAELEICIDKLRLRSLRIPKVALTNPEVIVDAPPPSAAQPVDPGINTTTRDDDVALLATASAWLQRLGYDATKLSGVQAKTE